MIEQQAPVQETPVQEAPAQSAPAQEAPTQAPMFEEYFAQPTVKPARKKWFGKSWKVPLIAATASVAVCAVLVVVFWTPLKGFWLKNFGKDEDYELFVETKSTVEPLSDGVSKGYGTLLSFLKADKSAANGGDMSVKFTVNEQILSLLETQLRQESGMNLDLDWINRTTFNVGVDMQDDLAKVLMDVKVGDKKLVDMLTIADMGTGNGYVAFPFLSDKYIGVEIPENTMSQLQQQLSVTSENLAKLAAVLPSEQEVNTLLKKYLNLALNAFTDADQGSETVSVGDISQKLTTIEIEVTEEDLYDVMKTILKEVKKDDVIEDVIVGFAENYPELIGYGDADDVYESFVEGIEYTLESMDEYEPDDEELFTLINYVNNSHEIVGRTIEVDGEELVSFVTVRKGDNLACEFKMEELVITGEGTEKKDVYNVDFTIEYDDMKFGIVSVSDFSATEERVKGKITVALSDQLLEESGFNDMVGSMVSLANPELSIAFDITNSSVAYDVNVLGGGDVLIGASITIKTRASFPIQVPSANDVYTEETINGYIRTIDLSNLKQALREIGIPTEYVDYLENMVF